MTLARLLAHVRAEPNHLYWRWRLLTEERLPASAPRAVLLDSLMRLTKALPGEATPPPELKDWTLREARAWVALLKEPTKAKTALKRAGGLFGLVPCSREPDALLKEALTHFDQVPLRERRTKPLLWGALLQKARPVEFERALPEVLKSFAHGQRASFELRTVADWALDETLSASARKRLRTFIDGRPDGLVAPGVRLRLLESDGVAALARGDFPTAGKALEGMAAYAPFDMFPGNDLKLVEAALATGGLKAECASYLAAVLTKEWRAWVRPRVEALAARCR